MLFVTKRSRWPLLAERATASAAPAIGSPETWRTPSTSRRMAAIWSGESIRVTRTVSIPRREIELRFSRSSGPGGQHAQKSETRVEAIFDVEALRGAHRGAEAARVIAKAGPVLRAVAQDERSQWRNRELATRAAGRGAARGAEGPAQAAADEAEQGRGRAAPRPEAAAQPPEAAAPRARIGRKFLPTSYGSLTTA